MDAKMMSDVRYACSDPDPAAVNTAASRALSAATKPEQLIDIGIICRDQDRSATAFHIFDFIVDKWPAYIPAYYEAAFGRRLLGEHLQSARLLTIAKQYAPHNLRVATFFIHMLHSIGAHDEAAHQYKSIISLASPSEIFELEALREFGNYITRWPRGSAMLLLDRIQRAYGYLDTYQVAERVISALDTRQPFALIRLGDGEGSCMTLGPDDEARFVHLYAQNRHELNAMWFGPDFSSDDTGFTTLSRTILPIALETDIVGIPYEGWLSHEYKIASTRGIPSLVNVQRAFEAVSASVAKPVFCSQQIHMALQSTGQLERIIRHARRVSVISCLPELPDLLQRHFALDEVVLYRIPGEKGSAAVLGNDATVGTHYPDIYSELRARLERPHNGRLFLIAGGILGKFYAATIRHFGGVALDIGSVVDGWASKPTRPGMGVELALGGD